MASLRIADSIRTVSTVYEHAFLDLLISPRRFRMIMMEYRSVSDMLIHPGIESLHSPDIPTDGRPLNLLTIDDRYGNMSANDLYLLLRVIRWVQPRRIFEIGTFRGVTTSHMAANCDAQIFTLDLPSDLATGLSAYTDQEAALVQQRQDIGISFRQSNGDGRVRQLWGNSLTFDYKPYHHSIDLVLVDGCHLYDYVLSDSHNAFEMVKENGVILWHDYADSLDVTRAIRLLAKDRQIFHLERAKLAMHVQGSTLNRQLAERRDLVMKENPIKL